MVQTRCFTFSYKKGKIEPSLQKGKSGSWIDKHNPPQSKENNTMAKRPDGFYVREINPYQKLVPHIMPKRYDAMNMTTVDVPWSPVLRFLEEQRNSGNDSYTYMDVLVASLVRLFAMRPSLNRFVMNKKIYQHHDIAVAFVVKKQLNDESEDTTVKIHFKGNETIGEVHTLLNQTISDNTGDDVYNDADKLANFLSSAPHWLIALAVKFLGFLDRHNWLPASIIETSPFHNSMFLTFLKSINGDALYHHCYEFGTTGIFLGFGKDRDEMVVVQEEPRVERMMKVGVVVDERFCDGLYFVNSMRLWKKILMNPSSLLEPYPPTNVNE
jgi:hypothetical protein